MCFSLPWGANTTVGSVFSMVWGRSDVLALVTLLRVSFSASVIAGQAVIRSGFDVTRLNLPTDPSTLGATTVAAPPVKKRTEFPNSVVTKFCHATSLVPYVLTGQGKTVLHQAVVGWPGGAITVKNPFRALPCKAEDYPLMLQGSSALSIGNAMTTGDTVHNARMTVEIDWAEVSADDYEG